MQSGRCGNLRLVLISPFGKGVHPEGFSLKGIKGDLIMKICIIPLNLPLFKPGASSLEKGERVTDSS